MSGVHKAHLLLLSIEFPPGPGGIGTYAYQLARHFSLRGWQVSVASPQRFAGQSTIEDFNHRQSFQMQSLQFEGSFLAEGIYRLWKVFGILRKERPDVMVAFGRQAAWLGAIVSFLTGISLVVTGVGTEFTKAGWLDRSLTRWAYRQARLAIAISQFTRQLAGRQGFRVDRMHVIPLGADDQLYRRGLPAEEIRARLGLGDRRVILTVGQVSERKAQDVVIRALPAILQICPEVVYLVVGLPTKQPELERLAEELGVSSHVVFTGALPQEELPYIYNLADIFVLVSRRTPRGDVEGFGIAAVEAALCGVPVVVSANSGLVEAVVPEVTALVVPQEDPAETAKAITRLLQDEPLRRSMGEAAYRHARETSTWTKRMDEYHRLIEEVLAKEKR